MFVFLLARREKAGIMGGKEDFDMLKHRIAFCWSALALLGGGALYAQSSQTESADSLLQDLPDTPDGSAQMPDTQAPTPAFVPRDELAGMSPEQIRELGVDFAEGRKGCPIDEVRAVSLFIRAADMGDAMAQRWMGWRYRQGRGVEQDELKATEYFKKAAEQGDQAAAEAIGLNPVQAASPTVSSSGMSASELRELGADFAEGRKGRPVNEQMAIQLYIKAADMGDMKAQRWMGWRYRQGRGVKKDESLAYHYFSLAANQGDAAAAEAIGRGEVDTSGMSASEIRELGVDYAEGRKGKPVNEQQAIKLYIKAADMGDIKAQRWMGWRYRQGRGVQKDEDMAYYYFNMAANQGDSAAAEAIGRSASVLNTSGMSAAQVRERGVDYAEGRKGKPVNEQLAIQLYIKAADMGDVKAQRWMGWRYRQGRGVPKNESTARYYFQRAAAQGDKAAADALRM